MSVSFKKFLLAGTALAAASFVSVRAEANNLTLTGVGQWHGGANGAQAAVAGDNIALGGNVLTVKNDGVANDGTGLNSFVLGTVTTGTNPGALAITTGSTNNLAVTVASLVNTVTVADTTITNRDIDNAAVAVTFTGALTTSGGLTVTNTETTVTEAVTVFVGSALTVTGASSITGGSFDGSDATLTLSGAGVNAFTGGVTLADGAAGKSTLVLNGTVAQTLNGTINGGAGDKGTLTILNTNASGVTFGGAIGGVQILHAINAGVAGTTTTFNGAVKTTTLNVTGTGTIAFGASALTGNVSFAGNDGAVTTSTGGITGTVDTTTSNTGTLTLTGAATIGGAVGGTKALKTINAGASGTSAFSSDVQATTTNVTGTGTVAFSGHATTNVAFGGNDGTVSIATGKNLTGKADTTTSNTGTLTIIGTSTVSGTVGATKALKVINTGANGSIATFSGNVVVQTASSSGTGETDFNGNFTGIYDFLNKDGLVKIADTKNLTGSVDASTGANSGTLTLLGTTTVSGAIGTTNTIKVLNVGAAGKTGTFSSTVKATNINITSTGAAEFNDNVTGALNFAADGTATVAADKGITGAVDNTSLTANKGTLIFAGSGSMSGTLGATAALKVLTLNGTGGSVGTGGVGLLVTEGGNMTRAAATTNLKGNTLAVTGTMATSSGNVINSTIVGATNSNGTVLTGGNITTTGAATIDPGTKVNLTLSTNAYIANGAKFTVVAGTGGVGVGTLTASNITIASTNGLFTVAQDAVSKNGSSLIIDLNRASLASVSASAAGDAGGAALDALTGAQIAADGTGKLAAIQAAVQNAATPAALTAILESIVPTTDSGANVGAISVISQTGNITEARMDVLRSGDDEMNGLSAGFSSNGANLWMQGYGQVARQDALNGGSGYSSDTAGIIFGVDTTSLVDGNTFGVDISYGRTRVDSKNANTTKTNLDNYGIGLYGSYNPGARVFLNGQIGYAYNTVTSDRSNVGGLGVTAHGDYHSGQYSAKLGLGRDFSVGDFTTLTPMVTGDYNYLSVSSYTETGAGGANLSVGNQTIRVFNVGGRLTSSWKFQDESDGSVLRPALHIGYAYDTIGNPIQVTSNFTGGGATFTTTGASLVRGQFDIGTSLVYMTGADWDLAANYDYSYKSRFGAHNGTIRATAKF